MRTAATFATEHGGKKVVLLFGPDTGVDDQKAEFKKLPPDSVHPKFERVELWESDSGIVKYRKFITPKEDDRRKKANAELEASAKKLAEKSEEEAKADKKAKV